jgi:hypothetical protein
MPPRDSYIRRATIFAVLVAIEFFGKQWRKPQ